MSVQRNTFVVSRRTALVAAAASLAVVAVPTAALATPKRPQRMRLPAPSGLYGVGVTDLHLIDRSRPDPWRDDRSYRELMISVFYPAERAGLLPYAPQMLPGAAAQWDQDIAALGLPSGAVDWAATRSHARRGAPAVRSRHGHPVILYSPGKNMPRTLGTVLATDLASQGYTVVTVDHTYETTEVEFPGGRVETLHQSDEDSGPVIRKDLAVRVTDLRFVTDELHSLRAGRNPDAEDAPLPPGLSDSLDISRLGVFGHSLGGATAAQLMHDDPRIAAGVDLDGALIAPDGPLSSVATDGLDRPFLIMDSAQADHTNPGLSGFWENLRNWRLNLQLLKSMHYSYTDLQVQVPQLAGAATIPVTSTTVTDLIGSIDPRSSVRAQSAYLAAFFDQMLKHRKQRLLTGPSHRFPQMRFVP